MEPVAQPPFPNFLFHLFDAAKFDSRGPFRLLRRHARANVFCYQHFQVRVNFLVEVRLHTPIPKQIPHKLRAFTNSGIRKAPTARRNLAPTYDRATAPIEQL